MKINHYFSKKFSIIFFLGFASGMPIVLILSTLKVLLVEKGFDLKTIGFLSLASIPYSLKFLYAPIIDSFSIPFFTKKLGQRRSWILFSQLLLIAFISLLGQAGEAANLTLIIIFSFALALISASQDIAIDAYRIELFEKENQGFAAAFYTYGYRVGMLISGAFALFLADKIGWNIVYYIMASFMFVGVIATIVADEKMKEEKQKNYNFFSWFADYAIKPFVDFTKRESWFVIFSLIVFFKLSDVFAGSLTLPFLISLDFTKTEIAAIVKTFGLFATLLGVFCGGLLVKKANIYKSLWIALIFQGTSNLAFSYLAQIGHSKELLYFVIFIENFSGGIGDAVFVAYLSGLCNINFSATQFATLTSFASLARSVSASSVGIFAEYFGWYGFFIFSAFLVIPAMVFLWMIWKNKVARF